MLNILSSSILVIPLFLCLLISLAIIIEKLFVLRKSSLMSKRIMGYLCKTVTEHNALDLLQQTYDGSPIQRLLITALANENESKQAVRQAINDESQFIAHHLERFLNMLGTIAVISPLLGLLGTVLGMIQVFDAILEQGTSVAPSLADGISQALGTTALGMAIAIPSVFFFRFFHRRIDGLLIELEFQALNIINKYRR